MTCSSVMVSDWNVYQVTLMNICACVVNYRNIMTTLEMLMDRRKRSVHRQRSKSSSQPFDQLNDSSAVQTFKGGFWSRQACNLYYHISEIYIGWGLGLKWMYEWCDLVILSVWYWLRICLLNIWASQQPNVHI